MRSALKLNSTATGYYWVDGDPGYWQFVRGKVIKGSKKVFADGLGIGYFRSSVQFKTAEGTKVARIIKAGKKCFAGGNAISFLLATVGQLEKLRDAKVIGKCSRKVYVR